MSRDSLQTASEALRNAAAAAESAAVEERLYTQSRHLAELATADRGPDHGRLARIEQALQEADAKAEDSVSDHIDDALQAVRTYRETVDGV